MDNQNIDGISRATTVVNVLDSMREKIILQEYKPDSMLTEVKLAEEYGTSRGSIRAALQELENEGLIQVLSNGRKRVVGITEKFIHDLYDIRMMLECKAADLVIKRKGVGYSALAASVEAFHLVENAPEETVKMERVNINAKFHRTLLEMSDNRSLLQCWITIEPVVQALAKLNSSTLDIKEHQGDYVDTHEKLLELLIAKDPEVIHYLSNHIMDAKRDTLIGLKKINLF